MATTIGITTGALSASRTFQNDAEAQAILIRCADRIGATGTNQQKLTAIVDWCVRQIQQAAVEQDFDSQRSSLLATIQEGNKLT